MYNDLTGKRPKCSACRHQIFGAASLFLCGAEIGLRADLSRQNAAVVRQIALEQIGRVQLIGTAALALATAEAVLDLLHFGLHGGGQPALGRRAADHQGDARALVDLDPGRAGQAVAAAAAEFAGQLSALLLDKAAQLRRQRGGSPEEAEPLLQLLRALDAPDGKHVVILRDVGKGGAGVRDEAACQRFHGDQAHVRFAAALGQRGLARRREIAEGILQRFIETGGDDILCNADLMRRDADMADLALRLCLEHGLVHAGAVTGTVALPGHVELVDIDVVALQQAQGRLQIGPERERKRIINYSFVSIYRS